MRRRRAAQTFQHACDGRRQHFVHQRLIPHLPVQQPQCVLRQCERITAGGSRPMNQLLQLDERPVYRGQRFGRFQMPVDRG